MKDFTYRGTVISVYRYHTYGKPPTYWYTTIGGKFYTFAKRKTLISGAKAIVDELLEEK